MEPFKIAIFLKNDFQKSDDYSNIHAMQQIVYELRNSIIILCPNSSLASWKSCYGNSTTKKQMLKDVSWGRNI